MPQPKKTQPAEYIDLDELLDDRRDTVLTLYNKDKTRSAQIKLAFRPGAITGRMLRAFRELDDSGSNLDQTTGEFLSEVLIEWNLLDKHTGKQLGTSYADIETQRMEVLVPVMQHIADEMFADKVGDANPKAGSAR